jgi:pimeloyl-ACP methyl ester carboxylesterase
VARLAPILASCLTCLVVVGCGSDAPSADPQESPSGVIEGSFDVGGHELYLSCHGTGSPTVVYLHGAITDEGIDPVANASAISDDLSDDYRVCLYDRRNVAQSDVVDAVQTPADAVHDLERLLDQAGVEAPYVLLGASYGGLLSYLYANEHPDDVVGMVLLAAMFPDELSLEHLFAPEDRLKAVMADQESNSLERMSQYRGLTSAQPYIGKEPEIPVIYLEPENEGYDDNTFGSPEYRRRVDDVLAGYVDRFSPGILRTVDAPHFMEPVIPEEIADAVREVVASSGE